MAVHDHQTRCGHRSSPGVDPGRAPNLRSVIQTLTTAGAASSVSPSPGGGGSIAREAGERGGGGPRTPVQMERSPHPGSYALRAYEPTLPLQGRVAAGPTSNLEANPSLGMPRLRNYRSPNRKFRATLTKSR
ncbi:hypothetical protein BRAO285_720035 [Bradyrhizobium sp. ORS 285]|nr:hypothetical protein BRAO285_720035 [Bradyrhizobium sp. ORS 285]